VHSAKYPLNFTHVISDYWIYFYIFVVSLDFVVSLNRQNLLAIGRRQLIVQTLEIPYFNKVFLYETLVLYCSYNKKHELNATKLRASF